MAARIRSSFEARPRGHDPSSIPAPAPQHRQHSLDTISQLGPLPPPRRESSSASESEQVQFPAHAESQMPAAARASSSQQAPAHASGRPMRHRPISAIVHGSHMAAPPSSFKNPAVPAASSVSSSSSPHISRDALHFKRRPRSTEIGQKAKDALSDLGRVARELPRGIYNLRNLSRSDVSSSSAAAAAPAPSLDGHHYDDEALVISPSMSDTDNLIPVLSSPKAPAIHTVNSLDAKSEPQTGASSSLGLGLLDGSITQSPCLMPTNIAGSASKSPNDQHMHADRHTGKVAIPGLVSIPKQLSISEQLFATSPPSDPQMASTTTPSTSLPRQLRVDFVELNLDDVQNDSPTFRAALQGLDRRTAALKKTCKAVLKAAEEASSAVDASLSAEARLDGALEEVASVLPSSFGILFTDLLSSERVQERARREETKKYLASHVVEPVLALTEMCREVVTQLKLFDAESKSYYSATQKWLSSRSSPASNATAASTVVTNEYSPDAVGYGFDKAALKQEKLDEKQRVRQNRFDLARYEVYRSVCALHAGEAELLVASHLLALCRLQCQTGRAAAMLHSYEQSAGIELAKARANADMIQLRCQELEAKATELQKEHLDVTRVESTTDDGNSGAGIRLSGNKKLKALLASIGVSSSHVASHDSQPRQYYSCPIPPVESFEKSLDIDSPSDVTISLPTTAQDDIEVHDGMEFGALNRPRKAEVTTHLSPTRWQAKLRTVSFSKNQLQHEQRRQQETSRDELSQSSSSSALQMANGQHEANRESVDERRRSFQQPVKRRSISFSGQRSPALQHSSLPQSPRKKPSPLVRSPVASSAQLGHLNPALLAQPAQVQAHAQPTRKKEGILWVMTKPIQGASGADAPRAVLRSQNWRESWVVLSGSGHLGEFSRWKDPKSPTSFESSQPVIDLRFATVREARGVERRFTFEVVTRDSRRFFQASNEDEMRGWISAIGLAIESLINGTSSVRQVEKVARKVGVFDGSTNASGGADSSTEGPSEFAMRQMFDAASSTSNQISGLGIRTAFSQSLTDLSSSAGGRLFHRVNGSGAVHGGAASGHQRIEEGSRDARRDSRHGHFNALRGHLAALSEGASGGGRDGSERGEALSGLSEEIQGKNMTPTRSPHIRGISNHTPVHGYVGSAHEQGEMSNSGSNAEQMRRNLSSTKNSLDVDNEYDKRIELMVNTHYGKGDSVASGLDSASTNGYGSGFSYHSRQTSHLTSVSASRMPSSSGQTLETDEEGQSVAKSTSSTAKLSSNDSTQSTKYSRSQEILSLAMRNDNRVCADCRRPDPRWASWSLHGEKRCIFICISCSGIHRGLGVSVSKVRSVDLDDWSEEQLTAARLWGNARVNAMYEARKPEACTVASMGDTRTKAFWTAKYVDRSWFVEETMGNGHGEWEAESEQERPQRPARFSYEEGTTIQPHDLTPSAPKRRPNGLGMTPPSSHASPLQPSKAFNRSSSMATPSTPQSRNARWSYQDTRASPSAKQRLST